MKRFGFVYPRSEQSSSMRHDEGKELVEYALIAALTSIIVALLLSGLGPAIGELWRTIAEWIVAA